MARILNANLDTNLGGENASNEVVSSQKAVKTYVDDRSLGVISDTDGDVILGSTLGGISGGSTITVDTTLNPSSTNPVQNSAIATALNGKLDTSNFIPNGTVINIKADGSKDFTTLTSAINYLYGKWSNGTVYLKIDGAINDTAGIVINTENNYNIPVLVITGINSPSITYSSTNAPFLEVYNARVIIQNISIINSSGSSSSLYMGISSIRGSIITFSNVSMSGGFIIARQLGQIEILGNLTINNNIVAIYAQVGGSVSSDTEGTITSNCQWLMQSWQGGYIAIPDGKGLVFTGVEKSLVPNGTVNTNGYTRYPAAWDE